MPKLLSRSKHEEFESNSALQIGDQKERRAENAKKMEHCEIKSHCHCSPSYHYSSLTSYCPFLHFFFSFFSFLPKLSLVIAFSFGDFCNLVKELATKSPSQALLIKNAYQSINLG